ncbi:nucleotidyl transferase AbiEii/AbiGii toxin family protein [Plantibacter sp. ME-Dv--P-095]|uniref:nucleotidyl transferase AbiEii/AbiGii toxin family protein n=1 Tax=Plantibacter sp. ME-Dv--P-095 TaxID=3040299 RepID=UPI00254C0A00|nr:nucleotidyl transferase AbiEii/AbiGii toxin family protein [Plantibacter sp. ME-Dv--P-095]
MTYDSVPPSLRSLRQRVANLEGDDGLVNRRTVAMALVVVGQMLPAGAIKGGSAMALRYGRATRFTRDLDAARPGTLAEFVSEFEERLRNGWAGFTGRLIERTPPKPAGVPATYVMQPFDVKLDYRGRPWCTVTFELGHNEIGDADEPEIVLSDDLAALFEAVGLPRPEPVHVMRSDHQIAQKLHAATGVDSQRAHDLIDLQLLDREEDLDLELVRETCTRLFAYRGGHEWPPLVVVNADWDTLYETAADGVEVLPDAEAAAVWANDFIRRIDAATAEAAI